MDRMNATELAANQFRMTQTRDKLARESIRDQQQAIRTHEQVGKEVRDAIKTSTPKLELDQRDAGGLLGDASDKKKDE